jgi:hypothetical protein
MKRIISLIGIVAVVALVAMTGFAALAQGPSVASAPGGTSLWSSGPPRRAAAAQAALPVARVETTAPPAEEVFENALAALEGLDAWHTDLWLDVVVSFRSIAFDAPLIYSGNYEAPGRMVGTTATRLLDTITIERDTIFKCNTIDGIDPETGPKKCSVFKLLEFGGFQISDIKDLELVGIEDLDGTEVYHLAGTLVTENAQDLAEAPPYAYVGELHFDMWIGVEDNLTRVVTLDGNLDVVGWIEGTIELSGTTTFTDYGGPWSAADAEAAQELIDPSCAAAGEGFVAFYDPAHATRFCYPGGWVVDNLVDGCGFYAVTPTGVGHGKEVPKTLVSVFPPATVSSYGHWTAGVVEVFGQPSMCFYDWVKATLQPGNDGGFVLNFQTIARIAAWILADGPLYSGLTGTHYPGAKAVSLGGAIDGNTNGPTVEAIIDSVVVGEAAGP